MGKLTCKAAGDEWACDREAIRKGLCNAHHLQVRRSVALKPAGNRGGQPVAWWIDGLRRCQTCKGYQDPTLYGRNVKSDDGLSPICKPCLRERELVKKYGITLKDYDALLASQKGGCAICGTTPEEDGKALAVDHDHGCCSYRRDGRTCGNCVRGLLCESCNLGIGKFEDDVDRLEAAITYLKEWNND